MQSTKTATRKRLTLIVAMSLLPALSYVAVAGWYHWHATAKQLPDECKCGTLGAGSGRTDTLQS